METGHLPEIAYEGWATTYKDRHPNIKMQPFLWGSPVFSLELKDFFPSGGLSLCKVGERLGCVHYMPEEAVSSAAQLKDGVLNAYLDISTDNRWHVLQGLFIPALYNAEKNPALYIAHIDRLNFEKPFELRSPLQKEQKQSVTPQEVFPFGCPFSITAEDEKHLFRRVLHNRNSLEMKARSSHLSALKLTPNARLYANDYTEDKNGSEWNIAIHGYLPH